MRRWAIADGTASQSFFLPLPCWVHKRRNDAGESKQGEHDKSDEREDHGKFMLPGSRAAIRRLDIRNTQMFNSTLSGWRAFCSSSAKVSAN